MKSLLLFFLYLAKLRFAIEYKAIEEFTAYSFTTSDAPNWTKQLVFTCSATSYIDFSLASVFGIFGKVNPLTKKTVTSLPPHWSASIRFDMLLYQALDAGVDYVSIQADTQTPDKFQKNANGDGVKICGTVSNDILVLYNKNFTHSASSLTLTVTASMNKLEAIQGFVMKNLFIFVDTCHFSCATCNGPNYDQCSTCPPNATKNVNICTCNTGFYAHQFQCVASCPTGFVPDSTNSICVTDFCATADCTTCVNKLCTVCAGTKKLLNGQCVISCPSYAPLTSGVCKDYSSSLTNGKYLIKGGLSADIFGESEVSGLGFVANGFKGTGYSLQSGATVTRCGGKSLLGGAFLSGSNSYIQRTFSQLSPHWSVLVGYTLYKIDTWENERVELSIDGSVKQSTLRTTTDGTSNLCGLSAKEDIIKVSQNFTHVVPTMALQITTTLDQDPFDESFGIRDIFVLVDFCIDNCQNCDASGCLVCATGFFLYQKTCYNQCPSGTYALSSSACADCHISCKTCTGGSNKNCINCKPSTYLNPDNSCQSSCVDNYWTRDSDLTCQKCDTSCFNCISPGDSGSCTACSGLLYLSNKQCQINCPSNQTKVKVTNNNTCQPCHSSCLTCNGTTANSCTSCLAPNLFLSSTFSCGTTCNSNEYQNTTNQQCSYCDISCAKCNGPLNTNCLSCSGSLYFDSAVNKCVSTCPDKQYKNTLNNKCTPCDSTCAICTGPTSNDCSSCELPRYLQAGSKQCVLNCNNNQYQDDALKACKSCDPSCASCSGANSNNCKSCTGQLYLDQNQNKCVQTCPFRYYQDKVNNLCSKCDGTCYTCDGGANNNCLSCELPRYYQVSQRQCVTQCNQNQYKSDSTNSCLDCDSSCATCSEGGSSACTSCSGNLFLDKIAKKCVQNCPSGYFKNSSNQECNKCDSNCETCFGPNNNNCLSCSTPYYFQSTTNKCVIDCAVNEYKDRPTKQCAKCHPTCGSCLSGSDAECLSCTNNLYLDENGNRCLSICPVGTFANKINNICDSCDPSCFTCEGGSEMSCLSCVSTLYYYKNTQQCLQECPFGSFIDMVNKSCFSCKDSCKTCVDEKTCSSCKPGYFFESQQCVLTCQDGNYMNKITSTCDKCDLECKTCYGPSNKQCYQCSDPQKASFKGSCLSKCPNLHYLDIFPYLTCKECNYKCRDGCIGSDEDDCISIKIQYQIIFYILLFKSAIWILTYIWGYRMDKYQSTLVCAKADISDIKSKNQEVMADSPNKLPSRAPSMISENIDTLKEIELDKDQNTITMNQTTITQKINRPIRRQRTTKLYTQVKPSLASFIENNEPQKRFAKKNSLEALEISNQSITINQMRNTNAYMMQNSTLYRQRSTIRNISVFVDKKPEIKANEKLKYAILGQEWISLIKFYNPILSRSHRATLIYLKYLAFFLASQYIYEYSLKYIMLCWLFGQSVKFIFSKALKLALSSQSSNYGSFAMNVVYLSFITCQLYLWFVPTLKKLFIQKDESWSIFYSSIFIADFLIFQPIFALFEYLITVQYLNKINNNKQSKIFSLFKNDLYLKQIK